MRLLRSDNLTFHSVEDIEIVPAYAILSHTWEEDEVTYKEMKKRPDTVIAKKGYQKIKAFASRARLDGFPYIWVDTCCIDKSSSAELSEAINSMFRLYRDASMCYAFLSDVPSWPWLTAGVKPATCAEHLKAARWFTRGWTLQELIAPRALQFYAADWLCLGTKRSLSNIISDRTGIPHEALTVDGEFSKACVAQRMSWAAGRLTTRREDAAYCLMGLFNVNMPMLYGEGERAFIRLQEEIIKISDDMSVFAWVNPDATFATFRGLLAHSPTEFAHCGKMWRASGSNEPYEITNKGLRLSVRLAQHKTRHSELIAYLHGVYDEPNKASGILLQEVGKGQYARIEPYQLADLSDFSLLSAFEDFSRHPSTCFVRQSIQIETDEHIRASGIWLKSQSMTLYQVDPGSGKILAVQAPLWNQDMKILTFDNPTVPTQKPKKGVWSARTDHWNPNLNARVNLKLLITVDMNMSWDSLVGIGEGWTTTSEVSQSTHTNTCFKPGQPVIEVLLERGIFDGESRLRLSVKMRIDLGIMPK